jgi:mycothiol synthase
MTSVDYRAMTRSDLQAVCDLLNEAQQFDGVPQVLEVVELEEQLDDDGDLTTDVRVAVREERIVGVVRTMHLPSDVVLERCYVFGTVLPAMRGQGIGRALMEWGVQRGRALLLSSTNTLPLYLRAEAPQGLAATANLFGRLGFREVRVFEELLRPLTELPAIPDISGVRIVPWPPDRDEEILTTKNMAFADHWGATPLALDRWISMVRGFGAWPEQSFIAVDDEDRVVAYSINHRYSADDELLGRKDGWIDNLGTLPEWRGRGIASALIIRSLHAFAEAGLTHASIGVDSDSLTGAARLYRGLGFEPEHSHTTWEIEVVRSA